jgi:hypothetical protein
MPASSHTREVETAKAAVARARAHLEQIDRGSLDAPQKKTMRAIATALARAERASYSTSWLDPHPASTIYEAARQALADIDRLERGVTGEQRRHVDAARAELHAAEDAVRDVYWHTGGQ